MTWKPKRFDVAGAHPDEAWRAVSDVAEEIKELRNEWRDDNSILSANDGGLSRKIDQWLRRKPMRFANAADRDVQQFLAQGVKLMDEIFPFGFGRRQYDVRHRCDELSKFMEKVLAKRPDERVDYDQRYAAWRRVEIYSETAPVKDGRLRVLSGDDMRKRYLLALHSSFPGGPAQAARARAAYHAWEENAERLGNNPPVSDAAKPWKRFLDRIEKMRERGQSQKNEVWGYVDPVNGIDFRPALTARPAVKSKPRMRM